MHHEVAVRILDGGADRAEEAQQGAAVEPLLPAVAVDRKALDVLHGQVERAILGHAAVQQS